jgi:hypothetical protein
MAVLPEYRPNDYPFAVIFVRRIEMFAVFDQRKLVKNDQRISVRISHIDFRIILGRY